MLPQCRVSLNSALQQLTVHATRRILAGTEICVSYSFDGLRREERQRHLRDIFGFACRCSKCTLSGDALRESDERLTALGDVDACARALCDDGTRHFLQHALQLDPATFLSRLDARFQLLLSEFPEGHMDGVECYLQLFVEVLERIASKLLRVADRADSGGDANALSKASAGALSSPGAVRDAAATYMGAAHAWALMARDASRDLKGEDSPAYGLWAAAIDEGCWRPGGGLRLPRPLDRRGPRAPLVLSSTRDLTMVYHCLWETHVPCARARASAGTDRL